VDIGLVDARGQAKVLRLSGSDAIAYIWSKQAAPCALWEVEVGHALALVLHIDASLESGSNHNVIGDVHVGTVVLGELEEKWLVSCLIGSIAEGYS